MNWKFLFSPYRINFRLAGIIGCFISLFCVDASAQVGINSGTGDPHPSSALDVDFDNRGFLPPRLTPTQRDQITNPATGLQIYNTESNCINYYNGTSWFEVCGICLPGIPSTPSAIQGAAQLLAQSSGNIYTINPVALATTYQWSVPSGWSILSGQGTTSIEVTAGNSGQNGQIAVTSGNSCGNSAAASLSVSATVCFGATFLDSRDNTTYTTVEVGQQCWMRENLRYLPAVSNMSTTGSTTAPHYYVYGYNGTSVTTAKAQSNYITYGAMYNQPAAVAACPSGWHLPTDAEWKTLEITLGMSPTDANLTSWRGTDQGTQLKTSAWNGTNSSGMTMLPGGRRYNSGSFITYGLGQWSYWWAADDETPGNTWARRLESGNAQFWRASREYDYGLYIRCVRN